MARMARQNKSRPAVSQRSSGALREKEDGGGRGGSAVDAEEFVLSGPPRSLGALMKGSRYCLRTPSPVTSSDTCLPPSMAFADQPFFCC